MNLTLSMIESLLAAHWLFFVVVLLLVIQGAASAIVAATPTPAPNSRLAKVYKILEVLALVIGYAKDTGLITPTASEALAAKDAVQLGRSVIQQIEVRPGIPVGSAPASPPSTIIADTIKALRDEGLLHPTSAAPPPPPSAAADVQSSPPPAARPAP